MTRYFSIPLAISLLALAPQASGRTAAEQAKENPLSLRIHIYDYAKPGMQVLARAKKEAARVFIKAGVDTTWLNCALTIEELETKNACSGQSGATDLIIRILPPAMYPPVSSPTETFGYALVGGQATPRIASILFGNVERLAWSRDTKSVIHRSIPHERYVGILLGHVFAHEIGHLLLASNQHSRRGLMQTYWNARVTEKAITHQLHFQPRESGTIRKQILQRLERQ